MKLKRRAPQAPRIQVVRWTGRGLVEGGWLWETAVVRLPDGTEDLFDIPLQRLGGAA